MSLHYLTVQDMIWINHCVTGKVCAFRYDVLEEATYYQYGYGASTDISAQAVRFLQGFGKKNPFTEGNEATGFVGFVAFLRANGKDVKISAAEAKKLMEAPADFIASAPIRDGHAGHVEPDFRAIVQGVLAEFGSVLTPVSA